MGAENVLYLHLTTFDDDAVLRGGALVVDSTTEPLEFRCTTAVRPTMLQRILWGARLDGHLATNLLGLPLIKSLKQDFSLVVVRTSEFLDVRQNLDVPLIHLVRDTQIEFEDTDEDPDKHERLQTAENYYSQLEDDKNSYRTNEDDEGDDDEEDEEYEKDEEISEDQIRNAVKRALNEGDILTNPAGRFEPVILRCERSHQDDIKVAREILSPIFATRDVLEPFDRIETALEAVHREESSKGTK